MKHVFAVASLAITFLFCGSAHAQAPAEEPMMMKDTTLPKPTIGVKLGGNFQTISGSNWAQAYNAGVTGGFFVGFHQNKIGFRAEILASSTSYKSTIAIDSEGNIGNFSVIYFNIPLLFEYNFIPRLSLLVGPQYSSMMSVSKKSPLDTDPKILYKAGEFSASIGLEAKLPSNFIAGARYNYGFTNINNGSIVSSQQWYTSSIQVYVGYLIKH